MRVRLILTINGKKSAYMKDYPLAVDEDEARSMMFRDHNKECLAALFSGRIQFNVEKLDTP